MLRVVSCDRAATPAGYSSISAVVQFDNDGTMRGVEDNVRLKFDFLREPRRRPRGGGKVGAYDRAIGDDDDDKKVDLAADDGDGGGDSDDDDDDDVRSGVDERRDVADGSFPEGVRREFAKRITPEPERPCPNGKKRKRTADDDDDDDGDDGGRNRRGRPAAAATVGDITSVGGETSMCNPQTKISLAAAHQSSSLHPFATFLNLSDEDDISAWIYKSIHFERLATARGGGDIGVCNSETYQSCHSIGLRCG